MPVHKSYRDVPVYTRGPDGVHRQTSILREHNIAVSGRNIDVSLIKEECEREQFQGDLKITHQYNITVSGHDIHVAASRSNQN